MAAEELYLKLSQALQKNQSPSRFRHSLAVSRLAAALAKKHKWDMKTARLAGLLHDWAKEWAPQKLRGYVKKHRLNVPSLKFILRVSPNLLHAYVSADVVRRAGWIVKQDALRAISSHTLASPHMGLAEKILFVADFSSSDRRFLEAKRVRQQAFDDIHKAFAWALALKIGYQLQKQKPLHPLVARVWNKVVCHL